MSASRPAAALAALLLAGCSYCDGKAELEAARAGDLDAVQTLGELGDPRIPSSASLTGIKIGEAIEVVAPFLESTDPLVRLQALEAVRHLATRQRDLYRSRFPTLIDTMLADPEVEIRWRAAWALGRLERTCPALREALKDPHPRVAERAAWAVGQARDEDAVDGLIDALEADPAVARQAARALGRITGLRHGPEPAAWAGWGKQWRARRAIDDAHTPPAPPEEPTPPGDD
ncbi:MAG: HEAT repeat domain-containing protein [Planctomycetes bacterium]|nr:HEAT repeat domain-containing protein [Planctomycetota bacterium]